MPELPSNTESSAETAPARRRRRLSGCAWAVVCVVLIVATIGFSIGWPIYRANIALTALNAKGGEIGHWTYYRDRPWHLYFVDEYAFVPGVDEVGAEIIGKQFTDDDVPRLVALDHFSVLKIRETSLTNEGLRGLAGIHNVSELWINHPALSDDDLGHILQRHWRLSYLMLLSPKLTQKAWESIIQFKGLVDLELNCAGMTLDGALPDLSSMAQLELLVLREMHVADDGLARLTSLPSLTTVELQQCRLSSGDFSGFPSLKILNLDECTCTAADLQNLQIPANVKHVRLNDLSLADADPNVFAGLSQLEALELKRSTFTNEHLHALASCTKLEELNLTGCQHVGDEQIPLFAAIPKLLRLDLTGTSITPAGLESLRTSRPNLNVIDDLTTE